MNTLSKTRCALDHHGTDAGGRPVFLYDDPDWERHTSIILDADVWEEMGRPETITVTVEPGDLLNPRRSG